MTSRSRASPSCLNCGATAERYCPRCGQKNVHYRASLGRLLRELSGELFALDSRLLRTLGPFLFRPGVLTRTYNDGQRARYVPPLRLYLFASLLCFLTIGVRDRISPLVEVDIRNPAESADVEPTDAESPDSEKPVMKAKPTGVGLSTTKGLQLPAPFMSNALVQALNHRAEAFGALPRERQSEILHSGMLSYAPTAIFLLLPLYAFLLKLAFLGTGRYYVEHVIFALHLHAFIFLALALITAASSEAVTFAFMLAIPVYSVLALRHAYASGWLATLLRATFIGFGYLFLMLAGVILVGMASVVLQA